jgi:hypothetical protein
MIVEEMVAMFLVIVGHGVGNRMIQERFQHSGETVSRHFHRVLHGVGNRMIRERFQHSG